MTKIPLVWLNGGPGCSSLDGLTKENGPLYFPAKASTPAPNPNSWTQLANVLYIDQPVGTGYSDGSNQATLNAQVTQDFVSWLQAFYDIFPLLRSKNTYIMGESYAGVYVSGLHQTSGFRPQDTDSRDNVDPIFHPSLPRQQQLIVQSERNRHR